jgi:hypothetical protein
MEAAQNELEFHDTAAATQSNAAAVCSNTSAFNDAVDTFKLTFEGLQDAQQKTEALQHFLTIPIVMLHIQRPSSEVTFDATGPTNCSTQEVWLYKQLRPFCWTYRSDIQDQKFYHSGTSTPRVLLKKPMSELGKHVSVMEYCDVHGARNRLHTFDLGGVDDQDCLSLGLKISDSRIWIAPEVKKDLEDGHATMFVHILDKTKTQVLLSIFIDSCGGFKYTQPRFCHFQTYRLNEQMSDKYVQHKTEIESGSMSIEQFLDRKLPGLELLELCDNTYSSPKPIIHLAVKRKFLINAQHRIQVAEDDLNCALYAFNFCKAVADMTADKPTASRIFALADLVEEGSNVSDATNGLRRIFEDELKQFLRQYYDPSGKIRPNPELKDYHMHQRWDISAQRIADFAITGV